jgi:hypothetical protein
MTDLNSKARAISTVVFGLTALILHIVPVISILINAIVDSLVVFSAILYLLALEKKGYWIFLNWIWSAFFLPLASTELLVMAFLSLMSAETIAVWGLGIYLSLLPIILWVMSKYFKEVIRRLSKENL